MCSRRFLFIDNQPALPHILFVVALGLFLGISGGVRSVAAQSPPSHLTSPSVDELVDSVAQEHVGPDAIPGAVVSVVQDTSIVFAKGYGKADVASERSANPERTLYRIGSLSKLFATTAVLQLVQDGQVDLHTDVNHYLDDVEVPARYGQPITLHHLLTHTPGFEERFVGMGVRDSSELTSLGPYLQGELPRRVRSPGTVASYSNHGMTLAGHLAATVADTAYVDLIHHHILAPIGMDRSAASTPALPDSLHPAVATPYHWIDGTLVPTPRTYIHLTPAGGALVTATDAAQFMIAHLNQGKVSKGRRILQPETVRQMHQQQFTHHPSLPGWAYGFSEHPRPSPRILMHGGGARGYTALLWLVPEHDLGVFMACNLPDTSLQEALLEAFNERFLPPADTTDRSAEDTLRTEKPSAITGHYRHVRYARSTFEKVLALSDHIHVATTDSGLVAEGLGAQPVRLEPLGSGLFRGADGGRVVFDGFQDGMASKLYVGDPLAPAYERVSSWTSPWAQGVIVGGLALVFLLTLIGAGVGWWHGSTERVHERSAAAGLSLAHLAFLVGFPLSFLEGPIGHTLPLFFKVPTKLKGLLALPIIALAATAYLAVRVVWLWTTGTGSARERTGLTVVVLASGAFGLLLHYWNLLGWQF